jgi:WD40 repeat protein
MLTKTRPRWDEFSLALFWTIAAGVLLYFGISGYVSNLVGFDQAATYHFSLPRFIISFGLICLAVFGLSYAGRIFSRMPLHLPLWLDNFGLILLSTVLFSGFWFSLFTDGVLIYDLFNNVHDHLTLAWGVATIACLVILAIYQILWSLNAFEPFLPWPDEFYNQKVYSHKLGLGMRFLLNLNAIQHSLLTRSGKFGYTLENISGPLLPELDHKTTVIEEKADGRPGLEKTLIAHGGWHVNTLGFTANGNNIFAVSDGGTVHFRAGGRKGMLFPPEIKFWETHTDKVQTASLGQTYDFLTRNFQTPLPLQNYRFLVPASGGKFALVMPRLIRLGEWQNNETRNFVPDEVLALQGFNSFMPIAINPEGNKVAWCNTEGQTSYWNLENDRTHSLRIYPTPEGAQTGQVAGAWGLVFSPDSTKIATIGAQGVLLQNVYTGWRWFAPCEPEREHLTAFAFNHNGFEMAFGLNLHQAAVKTKGGLLQAGKGALGTNGRLVLPAEPLDQLDPEPNTQQWTNVVRLWDLRLPDYVDLVVGAEPLREIAFSPDNQMLAAVDEAGQLRLWQIPAEGFDDKNLPNGTQLVAQVDLGMSGRKVVLSFSPDMQRLVCATDNRLLIYNLARLQREAPVEVSRQTETAKEIS